MAAAPKDVDGTTQEVDGVMFTANVSQGAWYAENGKIGTLMAPMNVDGSMDIANVTDVEVEYDDA